MGEYKSKDIFTREKNKKTQTNKPIEKSVISPYVIRKIAHTHIHVTTEDLRTIFYECICSLACCNQSTFSREIVFNISSLCHLYEYFATSVSFLAHYYDLMTQSDNIIKVGYSELI